MGLLDWLFGNRSQGSAEPPLDIESVLSEGMSGPQSAKQAISQLKRERKQLDRMRRAAFANLNTLTPGKVRSAGLHDHAARDMTGYHLRDTLKDSYESSYDATMRNEQLATIDGRIQSIDRAIEKLASIIRSDR